MKSESVVVLQGILHGDKTASQIVQYWDRYRKNIQPKLAESLELRNFIFATDTSTTSNSELGAYAWKNKTHLPKLAEIRDNLLAIYKATWFPNDNWMKWDAYSFSEGYRAKKEVIEGYMRKKVLLSSFQDTIGEQVSQDWIDYGNCFVGTDWRDDRRFENGILDRDGYVGPVPVRISPLDIAFDLTATSFTDSPKVIRKVMTTGDVALMADKLELSDPEQAEALRQGLEFRGNSYQYTTDDFNKAEAYSMDGLGNYKDYLGSECVEFLEFRGTLYDSEAKKVKQNHRIIVMDRRSVVKEGEWETWLSDGGVYHSTWRDRPDSLWGMGPLDNLVGMQYRLDHLQGAKDDNIDLHIHPTKVVIGDPDETDTGPNKEIRLAEGESIQFISPDLSALQIDQEIQYLLQLMEEFAGSPRQSRGFRTPGEKTLGEVSLLESNANRLFLNKAIKFEKQIIEPELNAMLAAGAKNLQEGEAIPVFDTELGVFVMLDVTSSDLQADGVLRPIGARHFGQRNQQLSNLLQIYNSPLGNKIDQHISGTALADLVSDNLQLERFGLISKYSAFFEAAEAQRVQIQMNKELQEEQAADTEGLQGIDDQEIPEEEL